MPIELNTKTPNTQTPETLFNKSTEVATDNTKAKDIQSKALEVLAGLNVKVTRSDDTSAGGIGERKTFGATNVPVLDNPDDAKAKEADLTKLMAYLQLDNQERQTQMAKDRIDMQKEGLDTEQKDRMKQIDESIKKMEKAEKAAKISRIFGWIGAALAIAAAVALTIVTGGLAAGFAIAGAVLAVTSLVLNETGAMDKMIEGLADHLQEKYGWDRNKAMLAASLIINISIMVLQLGCSIGSMVAGIAAAGKVAADAAATGAKAAAAGAKAAGEATKISAATLQTARQVQTAITVANTGTGFLSLGTGALTTYRSFKADSAKADTTELEKFMTMLQQRLEESQEELQKILEQIQSGIGELAQMIGSATDTSAEIAQNIGQMA